MTDDALAASYAHCKAVAKRHARNFYYGMRLTPEPKRSALFAVYAWMRAADQLGDAEAQPTDNAQRLETLRRFRDQTRTLYEAPGAVPPGDPMWPAFADVVRRFSLPAEPLHGMLDGQSDDLTGKTYETFDDLYTYCVRVASTVGQVCVHLWGHDDDPAVPRLAEQRGVALQLTNILRDVREDAQRGRCYLPAEDLARFNITPERLGSGEASGNVIELLRFQLDRARGYYDRSAELDRHIDPACRPSSRAIFRVYRALLDTIARDPSAVTRGRVRVSAGRKAAVALAAVLRR